MSASQVDTGLRKGKWLDLKDLGGGGVILYFCAVMGDFQTSFYVKIRNYENDGFECIVEEYKMKGLEGGRGMFVGEVWERGGGMLTTCNSMLMCMYK